MTQRNLITRSFLILITLLFLGCTDSEQQLDREDNQSQSEDTSVNGDDPLDPQEDSADEDTPRLPGAGSSGGSFGDHCEFYGYLTLREWLNEPDGMVIGTIKEIEPDLTKGYSGSNNELQTASECEGEITNVFRVQLGDLEGILHDNEGLPETIDIHFGHSFKQQFDSEMMPEVTDDEVIWPDDQHRLQEGMRIGGRVYQEHKITERWSMISSPVNVRPFFQVLESGEIEFQPMEYGPGTCGAWPPVEKISDLGEEGVINRISELDAEGKLSSDYDVDSWVSDDYDPEHAFSGWVGLWFGGCNPGNIGGDNDDDIECYDFEDCGESETCQGNECVDIPEDWGGR